MKLRKSSTERFVWWCITLFSIPEVVICNYTLFLSQCFLIFSWNKLQMLLRCYLIHITITILRHILHMVYLSPLLGLSLFMSYLYDLIFIWSLIFIVISHITSFKQKYLFFVSPVIFGWYSGWRKRIIFQQEKFSRKVLLSFYLSFCQFHPGFEYEIVAYKDKVCIWL